MSTKISTGIDDYPCSLLFITTTPIDCKITISSLYLFVNFFGDNYNIGKLTSPTSQKKRMTKTSSLQVPHPLINEKFICQKPTYLPLLTTLHSVIDREEYEEHKKYLFLPLWKYG